MKYIFPVCIFLLIFIPAQAQNKLQSEAGILYSYIALIYSGNSHFIDQTAEKDSIRQDDPLYNLNEMKRYSEKIKNAKMKNIFIQVHSYLSNEKISFNELQKDLESVGILISETRHQSLSKNKNEVKLDYWIFGKKEKLLYRNPVFPDLPQIYNIIPFIEYDEFKFSNETFYENMIYLNDDEINREYQSVHNAMMIKRNPDSRLLLKAFPNGVKEDDIKRLFFVYFSTAKSIDYRFNEKDRDRLLDISVLIENPFYGVYRLSNNGSLKSDFMKYLSSQTGTDYIKDETILLDADPGIISKAARKYFNELYSSKK